MGLIRQDQNGQWLDAGSFPTPQADAEQRGTEQQPAVEAPDEAPVGFDATDEADWSAAIEPLSQAAYDAAVARSITSLTHGTDPASVVAELSQAGGMDRQRAAEFVEAGTVMFEDVAARAVSSVLTTEAQRAAFRSHLESGDKARYAHILRAMVMGRDTGPLIEAAKAFSG
jgi:hypothetical protein